MKKSSQEIQDKIFQKMSAEESAHLTSSFYHFAKVLNRLEPISKMALKAKLREFRRQAAAAGAIRIVNTMSPEKAALQKFPDGSPNAFLRWVLGQGYDGTRRMTKK